MATTTEKFGTVVKSGVGHVMARGSIREGSRTWLLERMTSAALVPLSLWFLIGAVSLSGASYEEVRAWLTGPFNTTAMLLFVITLFWHAKLGAQVIIEDYVHHEGVKVVSLIALNFAAIALGLACVVAVLKVSLGS
ncbi:succinate dehydrogenase, hydrophobic membrane anchor protein [Benzoatithermus flavus]|uniref:Succinate dehydrogenase hydrophobic membrane anchor subunit n=1 Tax=Benzoatithermus flavus TaxID=3108223 RepID=A0ABU8Y0F9_9PROT